MNQKTLKFALWHTGEIIRRAKEIQENTMGKVKHYYYLHENGEVIWKPAQVTDNDPDYFVSPFVKKVWTIRTFDDQMKFMCDLIEMDLDPPRGGMYW